MARENYFATLEIPLLRGRGFTAQDDQHAPKVAIVSQTFARQFFPGDDVLGKRVTIIYNKREVEIVGVVADTKYRSQREEIKPLLYTPWQQEGAMLGEMHFALRTAGEPTALAATVRQVVRELDSNLPVTELGTQAARSQATLGQERLSARLLTFSRRLGALARRDRPVGRVGLFGRAAHQRDRHSHGARRASSRCLATDGLARNETGADRAGHRRRVTGYAFKRLLASEYFSAEEWQRQMADQLYV